MAIVNGQSNSEGNTLGDILYAIITGVQNETPERLQEMRINQALSGEQRNAYEALSGIFEGYGLGSLAPKILEYVQQGYGPDTITLLLQRTDEYKKRFAANEVRRKNGLPVLPPNEYLATESAYRQIMRSAGLPEGFYDSQDDFTNFLSIDVSPSELKTRVDLATQATLGADATFKESLSRMGVGEGGMIAWFLDPSRATPIIENEIKASKIGAEALRNKLAFNTGDLRQWAMRGVTQEQAREGYGQIAAFLPEAQKLAAIYGDVYDQTVAEGEVFGREGYAVKRREGLASKERATFGGAVGGAKKGLSGVGGQQ